MIDSPASLLAQAISGWRDPSEQAQRRREAALDRYYAKRYPISRADLVVLELTHLLGSDTPDSIARRLGYRDSPSLDRALCRWGRADLAQQLRSST